MQDKKEKKLPETLEKEISKEAYPLVEAFMSHLKEITLVVGLIIAVVLIYTGYKGYNHRKMEQAENKLKSIFVLKDKNEKIKRLNEFLKEAPNNLKYAIRMELARLYTENKDYKNAIRMWDEIEKNAKDESIKTLSIIAKAECFAVMNDYNKALTTISKIKDSNNYKEIVLLDIAKFAEANNKVNQAIWAYKKLKTMSPNDPNAIYYQCKLVELQKKLK